MRPTDPDFDCRILPLDAPRPLSAPERALAEHLAAPALREEVARACVNGVCACGCPSVGLESNAPPAPGFDGPAWLTAWTTRPDGRDVETDLPAVSDLRREPE